MCLHPLPKLFIMGNRSRNTLSSAGPAATSIMDGRINRKIGNTSFTPTLAARSSASWLSFATLAGEVKSRSRSSSPSAPCQWRRLIDRKAIGPISAGSCTIQESLERMERHEADVVIVGGGPVGMGLAIELGQRCPVDARLLASLVFMAAHERHGDHGSARGHRLLRKYHVPEPGR